MSTLATRIMPRYEIFVYTNYARSFHVSELETIKADMNSSLWPVCVCSVSRLMVMSAERQRGPLDQYIRTEMSFFLLSIKKTGTQTPDVSTVGNKPYASER
jgi:hypothetical protein